MANSDMATSAAQAAIGDAGVDPKEVDCIIFATLSPDIMFPGTGVVVQKKLGISNSACPCYDIRQQCSGFVYGMQMADAFIKCGHYKRVLLIGSELHSHSLDRSTRGRDVTVIFGDGAGAFLLGPQETDDERAGVLYTDVHADGRGVQDLYLKLFDTQKKPVSVLRPNQPG